MPPRRTGAGTGTGLADPPRTAHGSLAGAHHGAKFQDHFPSYRLSQRLARHGILIGDATLNSWIARGFEILQPLYDAIKAHVLTTDRLFLDETTVKFLEPGFGKARTGYLWAALRDDRTFAGPAPPAALFWSGPGRGKAIPEAMLRDFAGLAQVDRYAAYNILADPARPAGPVTLQICMTHWRRKFHYLPESRFRNEALRVRPRTIESEIVEYLMERLLSSWPAGNWRSRWMPGRRDWWETSRTAAVSGGPRADPRRSMSMTSPTGSSARRCLTGSMTSLTKSVG